MKPRPCNLLQTSAIPKCGETFITLLQQSGVHLEQIISAPATRSEPMLQDHDEWVLLLQGQASLRLDQRILELGRGDSLLIPAGTPHQVLDTSSDPACIWLALHLPGGR